jgi:hypothetical protein
MFENRVKRRMMLAYDASPTEPVPVFLQVVRASSDADPMCEQDL